MKLASLIIGIASLLGMFIGLVPCLGWFNWFNIPFALIGLIIGLIDIDYKNNEQPNIDMNDPVTPYKKPFPTGVLLCGIALLLSSLRLVLGGGIF
nr:hypothetical protein [uncultured Flavobacterium sp.]